MANIKGPFSVLNADTNDYVGEWQEEVLVRNATGANQDTPALLYGLMSRLDVEEAAAPKFNWFERDPVKNDFYINFASGYSTTDTSLIIDDGAGNSVGGLLAEGDILTVVTAAGLPSEKILITADPAATTITVTRGFAGTTAVALPDNTQFDLTTRAKAEGQAQSRSSYQEPEVVYNYIQTFNRGVDVTNLFKGTALRSDMTGPLAERRMFALEAIGRDIESAFFFGKRSQASASTGYRYSTGGIYEALNEAGLTSNILNGAGATGVTIDALLAWTQSWQTYGNVNSKLAFCGPGAFSAFAAYADKGANGFRIQGTESTLGMKITQFQTSYGEINLVQHPLFTQKPFANNWIIAADLSKIGQKSMEPLFLEENTQLPGSDLYSEQLRAKHGLKIAFAKAHGAAYNLSLIKQS